MPPKQREELVVELMAARRSVRTAKGDPAALRSARAAVDAAEIALGERGPVWLDDGAPDYSHRMVTITPYPAWATAL